MANVVIPFPSIERMSPVKLLQQAKYAFAGNIPKTLNFTGTVKLHGTHADLLYEIDTPDSFIIQSRNRVIDIDHDNNGSALFFSSRQDVVLELFNRIKSTASPIVPINRILAPINRILIAGEFCGSGVQSRVALCKLPKMFVIFGINIDGVWIDMSSFTDLSCQDSQIYNIYKVPRYNVELNTTNCEEAIAQMENYTQQVDAECPFAKSLGQIGFGEGIVWTCLDYPANTRLWFKTKGNSHNMPRSNVFDKNKPNHSIIHDFLTEERLEQGITFMQETNIQINEATMSIFIKYVVNDLMREESDTLEALGFNKNTIKNVASLISSKWYKHRQGLSSIIN